MLQQVLPAALLALAAQLSFAQTGKTNKADTSEITVKVITQDNSKTVIVDDDGSKWVKVTTRPKNVTTSWWNFDLGFSNYVDDTKYGSADAQAYAPGTNASYFDLRNGKSVNVNIWIFKQRVNLIKHVVNLKYALGLELNNYRYKNNIRYNDEPSSAHVVSIDATPGRSYVKNKLAADYLTMPLMLNFNFAPSKTKTIRATASGKSKSVKVSSSYGYGFSAGLSAGYLYAARNKFITSDEGKRKIKGDFDLRPWKISYVAELNLGYVSLYGSYATKSMYRHGLDIVPYNVGMRIGF